MLNKLKSIIKWVGTDGLLHFLVCLSIMIVFTPIIGVWWTILATLLVAILKEVIDYFIQKDNNKQQVLHDLIFDAAGILIALIVMILWTL